MLKQKKLHLASIFNNKGMSIVEVLVAAGLASIVALGVATMVQNMMIEQKKVVLLSTIKEKKTAIESLIRNQASWNNTINSADNSEAVYVGLRANGAIPAVADTAPVKIRLYNSAGNLEMNLAGPADAAGATTGGFTEAGNACNNFIVPAAGAAVNGNDACPFSYRLMMSANCPGAAASCSNPELKVVARLLFNPSAGGVLQRFKQLVNTDASASTNITNPTGSKYDVQILRTSSQVNRYFTISSNFTGGGGTYYAMPASNCSGYGAGACNAGSFLIHPLTQVNRWTEEEDSTNLVTASAAQNYFTFSETGVYDCTISVPGFATGNFAAELFNSTSNTSVAQASTFAGRWSQSTAVIQAKFNVSNVAHQYIIRQKCDAQPTASAPSGDPSVAQCSLGMVPSAQYGSAQKIIAVTCNKLDRSE